MVRKIFQPFYTAYVIVTFLISIIVVFPFILLTSFGANSTSRKVIHTIISCWSRFWLLIIGMPVSVSGVKFPEGRYIIVANHISYMDTLIIFPAIKGYFRPLGKKEITRIPVIGFIYKQIVILVDRSNEVSRAVSMRLMWRVLKKEGNIMIFPEGTFNETGEPLKEFYNGAFRLAITSQTNILPLVLADTKNRWHYSGWWKIQPGRNRVVVLKPISVQGMDMTQLEVVKEQVYNAMKTELMKYNSHKTL